MPDFFPHGTLEQTSTGFRWLSGREEVRLDAWAENAIRVRARRERLTETPLYALKDDDAKAAQAELRSDRATLSNGRAWAAMTERGVISFGRTGEEQPRLQEAESTRAAYNPGRFYRHVSSEELWAEARFKANPGERFYGLGQHQHGLFDQKGAVIELEQMNTEIAIPWVYSTAGYGFLWNNPARGRVELGTTQTRWVAQRTDAIDFLFVAGDTPAEVMSSYAAATGTPPPMPEYAAGFWQSKLRYRSQEELLEVAREYKRRGLPISVIVIDFFHWTHMGDWKFDPEQWPDPAGMVKELKSMGIETMVSIWPTVTADSENFERMQREGLLLGADLGTQAVFLFTDSNTNSNKYMHYYDPSKPAAREFVWNTVKQNYFDYGIRTFWLDACEPEILDMNPNNLRFGLGNMEKVACIYPFMNQKAFYDGMKAEGIEDVLNLSRSAWAGSQRFGSAVWSGDIDSTFKAFRQQIVAGLHMAMSGIPWWTTDIGGFYGGSVTDPYFRELVVRWFQYAAFCPLFRLHGFRDSWDFKVGGENEVWSFGEEAYNIIVPLLHLRERIKPYIMAQMNLAHESGIPPMRPLFFDFPGEEVSYTIPDQFMFGPDLLVAPVAEHGARSRSVYLPAGADWRHGFTKEPFAAGRYHEVEAPLDSIPLFLRDGADLPLNAPT